MYKLLRNLLAIAILSVVFANFAIAQTASTTETKPSFNLSGYAMGDFFMNGQNNNAAFAHVDGFWLRRAYLTADFKFDDRFSSRVRFEMNSNGDLLNNGSYSTKAISGASADTTFGKTQADLAKNSVTASKQINPYIKDLWLKYKTNLVDKDAIIFGIQQTPAFDFIENHWGYRQIERTPLDMTGIRSSRDFAISWQGETMESKLKWNIMYGNNSGTGALTTQSYLSGTSFVPTGTTSRFYLDFQLRPIDHLCLELYGDNDAAFTQKPPVGGVNQVANKSSLMQAHLSWTDKDFRIGVQYSMLNYLSINGGAVTKDTSGKIISYSDTTVKVNLFSVYAVYSVTPEIDVIARYDMYNTPLGGTNNLKTDPTSNSTYGVPTVNGVSYVPMSNNSAPSILILGVAYNVNKSFQIIPNVQLVNYKDKNQTKADGTLGSGIQSDAYGKITFFWKF